MDLDLLVPAAASLLGAVIGGVAVLMGQQQQDKRNRKGDVEDDYRRAVEELAVRANALDVASHQVVSLTSTFTSLAGQLNRLLGIVTPFDQQALFTDMNAHHDALIRAATHLRGNHDQETVRLTNAVLYAAAEIVAAHHAAPDATRSLIRIVGSLYAGKAIGNPDQIASARSHLAESVQNLLGHARRALGHAEVDLSAVPVTLALSGSRPGDAADSVPRN